MTEAAEAEVPVLVVGAGPAGLMMSLLLSRYGVASLLVERHAEVCVLPRAMGSTPGRWKSSVAWLWWRM